MTKRMTRPRLPETERKIPTIQVRIEESWKDRYDALPRMKAAKIRAAIKSVIRRLEQSG